VLNAEMKRKEDVSEFIIQHSELIYVWHRWRGKDSKGGFLADFAAGFCAHD
jgi:hypothetical protein